MNLSALSTTAFRRYLIGNSISLHGLWVQKITIGWMAWEATGSVAFLGWLAFLNYVPPLVLGPFFGVLVDRVDIRKAAMGTQILFIIAAVLLFIIHTLGVSGRLSLTGIALFIGVVTSAQHPIRMSITPRLAPAHQLSSIVLLLSLNFNVARVLGPAIGGVIIASFGVTYALVFTIVTFSPFVLILRGLSPRPNRPKPKATLRADFMEGLTYVLRSRFIRTATLITGVFALAGRGALEILPSLAEGSFQRGAAGLGTLTAAAGIGALLAAMFQIYRKGPVKGQLPTLSVVASVVGPLAVAWLGGTHLWDIAVVLVGVVGFTGTLVGVGMQSAIQLRVEDHLRGRVMSLWAMVAMGGTALGSLLIGSLADAFGLTASLQIMGIFTAGAAIFLIILRRLAQLRESR